MIGRKMLQFVYNKLIKKMLNYQCHISELSWWWWWWWRRRLCKC